LKQGYRINTFTSFHSQHVVPGATRIKVLIALPEQGFEWFSVIIHDTLWMLISCPHQHVITCTKVNIHSYNVPLQGILSIPIRWIYSSLLWTSDTVQQTSAQSISTFCVLILAVD